MGKFVRGHGDFLCCVSGHAGRPGGSRAVKHARVTAFRRFSILAERYSDIGPLLGLLVAFRPRLEDRFFT